MVQPAEQNGSSTSLGQLTFPPETQLIPEGKKRIFIHKFQQLMIPLDEYVDLEIIDLSSLSDSQLNVEGGDDMFLQDSIKRAMRGLSTTGFIALKGHGLSPADLQHQFSLGKLLLYDVSEEEKVELLASINEGSWAGYKAGHPT